MNKQKLILFLILLLSVSCLSSAQNTTEKLIRINGTEIFTKIFSFNLGSYINDFLLRLFVPKTSIPLQNSKKIELFLKYVNSNNTF